MFGLKFMVDFVKEAWALILVDGFGEPDKMASLALIASAVALQSPGADIVVGLIGYQDQTPSGSLVPHPWLIVAPRIALC